MSLFGDSDVQAAQVQINPEVLAGMQQQAKDANETTIGQHHANMQQGIGGPANYSGQMNQSEQALGGSEPGMSGAIASRYQGLVGQKMNNLSEQARLKAYSIKSTALQTSADLQKAKTNIDAENKRRQQQADLANEQARNGALSSVLGIGIMVAAGPMGAAAYGAAKKGGVV